MQYLEQRRSILAEYLVEFLVNSTISVYVTEVLREKVL
jgi:hypothetical protein